MKLKGINKIGCYCSARMIVKEEDDVEVKVMETHIGHEAEVGRFSPKEIRKSNNNRETIPGDSQSSNFGRYWKNI
jgi:hypothetical protein